MRLINAGTGVFARVLSLSLWLVVAAAQTSETLDEAQTQSPDPSVVKAAVSRMLAEPAFREELRLDVECVGPKAQRVLRVYGHGIGIWDSRAQLTLTDSSIVSMIELLDREGFAHMQGTYGGQSAVEDRLPADPDSGINATRITCLIHLEIGDLEKLSVQLERGEQSDELKSLAGAILDLGEGALDTAIQAQSLQAGLEKVARGELAAETLSATLHRKPDHGALEDGQEGFLLTVDGPRVALRSFSEEDGYSDAVRGTLPSSSIRELAKAMAGLSAAELPANLYSDIYTDMSLQVLDRRLNVQARQFAGHSRGESETREAAFQKIVSILGNLPGNIGIALPND